MEIKYVLPNPALGVTEGIDDGEATVLTTCSCPMKHWQSDYTNGTMCGIQTIALQLEAKDDGEIANEIALLESVAQESEWLDGGYGSARDVVLYGRAAMAMLLMGVRQMFKERGSIDPFGSLT